MTMLIAGVLLWALVHLFPVFLPNARGGLAAKLGEGPFKGLFTLVIVGAITLMVLGWRSVEYDGDHVLEYWLRHVTYLILLVSIILFGAAKGRSRIRSLLRHPMLTGMALWAIGHLLVNNDTRSLVLFGGMLLWSVISIIGLNRRDGDYTPPTPGSWFGELRIVLISGGIYAALVFGHPYFTGVPLF